MTASDRIALIAAAIPAPDRPARWAELGAGDGAFTFPLADRLGDRSQLLAVDRDGRALERLRNGAGRRAAGASIDALQADITGALPLAELDGALMANALHFVPAQRQAHLLASLARAVVTGGRIVVVEYDVERGNPWVPHPVSARRFHELARRAGLEGAVIVADVASRYWGRVYCGLAFRGTGGAR